MQQIGSRLAFSPSDLNRFLECEHILQLDRDHDEQVKAGERDEHAELLAAKGAVHEQAWLERFRAEQRSIATIDTADRDWARAAAATAAAMARGEEVIYQGVFADGDWRGISDFLVRVPTPSRLGSWSYEAWDTKLARQMKPYFVLQLCFYTEQLARVQGISPADMVVVLGTNECRRLAYRDFDSYYRAVRRRFMTAARNGADTYPYPVAHCALCEHARICERRWRADDHLSLVAHIGREQVDRLQAAGIRTVAALGEVELSRRLGIGRSTLERLRHQAALQAEHRRTGEHRYELLPIDERTGFRLLPEPSPGDVFFDMEGDPYYEASGGLEYLFGAVVADARTPRFHPLVARSRAEEKQAFEQFVDFVCARLERWPDLHVYHYAAYEVTALKRLMHQHATREEEMDDLLRREVFVDLYQVVRQSLRISHESYSIKKVRTFFMDDVAAGAVSDGGDSILAFERWRIVQDPAILQAIIDYNEQDCLSTWRLRDWLLARRTEAERTSGRALPWKLTQVSPGNPKRAEEDAATAVRREQLWALGGPGPTRLAHLLGYHRREGKPEWWAYFDRRKKSLDDLLNDTQAIAYLTPLALPAEKLDRSLVHALTFPEQEFRLGADGKAQVDDPFRQQSAGTIAWIDPASGRLGLKRGSKRAAEPLPAALVPGKPLDTSVQRQALARLADAVLAGSPRYEAVRDLLDRAAPRLRGRRPGVSLQTLDLHAQQDMVARLDASYLVIQGPPGSGKTWTAARLIVSLLAAGQRIGVAATSHKAINNLLREIETAASAADVSFTGLKKGGADDAFGGRVIRDTDDNAECESAECSLIAGTAWLFARERMDQRLDYLFVDEAGQVALADAAAMGTSARNLVLIGDPQQLPHVGQGLHPDGSGCSALEHVLGDDATVSEHQGFFLATSWRMHPDVCRFVSALSYEGRLASAPGCEQQQIASTLLSGSGLRYLPVEHTGNSQRSAEEARLIASLVESLLSGGTVTDMRGVVRPITGADLLVVAPYNMQVRCLQEHLPPSVEVGTVDKFQGREASVVFFSMASSSGEDVPRGIDFLFSRNRLNVAVSRARALAVLACSPRLLDARCTSVEQMRLVNAVCRFAEEAAHATVA